MQKINSSLHFTIAAAKCFKIFPVSGTRPALTSIETLVSDESEYKDTKVQNNFRILFRFNSDPCETSVASGAGTMPRRPWSPVSSVLL